ncbi:PAN domain protein [Ostertagia ostertagi]
MTMIGVGEKTLVSPLSPSDLNIFFSAVCENKATGFFVVDNTILGTTDSIVYKDTPEEDCLTTCSTNRDRFGRSILCASFVYDHASFTCTIFKEKAKPEGKADVVQAVGKRYFEKVCLGDDVPMDCADSQFIRADDSVLIGFARNVTLVETMEQCVEQCVKENDCKSAMYFYEEGECITNTESALSKPSAFAKEENEKVVYFQNGCLAKLQTQESATVAAEPTTTSESSETTEEMETDSPSVSTTEASDNLDDNDEADTAQKKKGKSQPAVSTEEPSDSVEMSDDHGASTADRPSPSTSGNGGDDDDTEDTTSAETAETTPTAAEVTAAGMEPELKEEDDDEDYVADEENEDLDTATTAKRLEKKGEKASYIKYKKHPKNFASKTAKMSKKEPEAETETTPAENTEEKAVAGSSSAEEEETGDSLAGDEDGEPIEGQTSPSEGKKHLSIKRVLENTPKEDGEDYPTYFSDWSDWTPCTKAGERQIRRRKCLDLRRCLGALMQVRNCPAVLPEPVQSGPIESVRSVIDVPRIPEYDDTDPGQVDLRQPSGSQVAENVWSPWLGVCQHFASGQPCNNGEMIGFESRECIAKEPSLCEGPFFRYCTLPC